MILKEKLYIIKENIVENVIKNILKKYEGGNLYTNFH